jgi:sugar phosphate isomerase/epimerase
MKPCFSLVTTLSTPFEDDIPTLARAGWTAVELWLTKLETYLKSHGTAEAKALLTDHGVQAVGAGSQGGLLATQGRERDAHWEQYRRRLDLLAELEVPTLVITGDFLLEPTEESLARAVSSLAEAAEAARPRGIRLALEFQKGYRFCSSLDTTLSMLGQVQLDNLGLCLDVFHYYTGPSKFEDLGLLSPATLFWLQLSDLSGTPRELAEDRDRILPGEGDFLLGPLLDQIDHIGYEGYASLEVFNPQLWQIPADRVAQAALQAMIRTLGARLRMEPMGPAGEN